MQHYYSLVRQEPLLVDVLIDNIWLQDLSTVSSSEIKSMLAIWIIRFYIFSLFVSFLQTDEL
ncbi:hypothetical protein FRX31_027144 [Thalictrum thalictroides]|uniref:Uncharacterized protein n=1 Tax=Thalictrum thalictroides TaxID=46969 RepID=A0A7J6VDU9_THATH|nr:hypothetical protein FRX31_027144 [Thalictrum thalictroides]